MKNDPTHLSWAAMWVAKNEYHSAIGREKGAHWRQYIPLADIWKPAKYALDAMASTANSRIPDLVALDGSAATTPEQKARFLHHKFFPNKPDIPPPPAGLHSKPLPAPAFSVDDILRAISRISPWKAPGSAAYSAYSTFGAPTYSGHHPPTPHPHLSTNASASYEGRWGPLIGATRGVRAVERVSGSGGWGGLVLADAPTGGSYSSSTSAAGWAYEETAFGASSFAFAMYRRLPRVSRGYGYGYGYGIAGPSKVQNAYAVREHVGVGGEGIVVRGPEYGNRAGGEEEEQPLLSLQAILLRSSANRYHDLGHPLVYLETNPFFDNGRGRVGVSESEWWKRPPASVLSPTTTEGIALSRS
ncbi:hypothetical protein B0H13DRAFT_2312914 [Mycena leptocephala]|nr:hypothetical protein B0H13DRAFT_2312914 [Mycena leptocephala]